MKKNSIMIQIKLYIRQMWCILVILSFCSCERMLRVDPSTVINAGDHYSSSGEIYGAFIGLASVFTKVAEQQLILSELRSDLMIPAVQAPQNFYDIASFKADSRTPYASPKMFYDIVINCNDFIRRVVKYNRDVPGDIPTSIYEGMIAGAIKYKVWSLFTIGQFWGAADIYNVNLEDNNQDVMVRLTLDELPQYLLMYLEQGEDGINGSALLDWKLLLDNPNIDWEGSNLEYAVLKGELNLWAGNYADALDSYLNIIRFDKDIRHDLTDFRGSYWSNIFIKQPSNLKKEVITLAPFNVNYKQTHQLTNYFMRDRYFVPTDKMIDLFKKQITAYYNRGDYRGLGKSYISANDQSYVFKYNQDEEKDLFTSDANIHIYRAAYIHLHIAEIYAFMGRFEESLTFLDQGLKKYWTGNKFLPPFQNMHPDLKDCNGVRGRASLMPLKEEIVFQYCSTAKDSLVTMCNYIADEVALELAFEGKRWPTLVRMAKHLNDPSFLSERVADKFGEENKSSYKALLNVPENWFIADER